MTAPLAQIIITKNVLGQYKIALVSATNIDAVFRVGPIAAIWRVAKHLCRLKPAK